MWSRGSSATSAPWRSRGWPRTSHVLLAILVGFKFSRCFLFHFLAALHEYNTSDIMCPCLGFIEELGQGAGPPGGGGGGAHDEDSDHEVVLCSAPSVPQPVVQSRRRPLLGPSPG